MVKGLKVPVLQVVGYQNSGKTTLINTLLQQGNEKGIHIGVFKHHGHSDYLPVHDKEKDTGRYRKNGAAVTGIAAGKQLEVQMNNKVMWKAEDIVDFYQTLPLDLILMEGFKKAAFPKIVMARSQEDLQLLHSLKNMVVVITWMNPEQITIDVPVFQISEEEQYIPWIVSLMGIGGTRT